MAFNKAAAGEETKQIKIRVVGIGGGASSVISELSSGVDKVSFLAINTDIRSLKTLNKKVKTIAIGQDLTRGLGTGMNSEVGQMAVLNDKEKIKKALANQDLCILVACLGGGVGSGATPLIAKLSRELGNITYGIFTLPFEFEGEKKMILAKESLGRIKPHLNGFTVIPNDSVFKIIDKNIPLDRALSSVNENLANSLTGLIETIHQPGLINIDFADLKTVFEGKGRLIYLNSAKDSGQDRCQKAIQKIVNNPFYPYGFKGAKAVIFNISGKKLLLEEVSQVAKTVYESVNKEAKIIFGISAKESDGIKITVLAVGCQWKFSEPKPRAVKPKTEAVKPEAVEEKNQSAEPVKKAKTAGKKKKKTVRPKNKKIPKDKKQNKLPKSKSGEKENNLSAGNQPGEDKEIFLAGNNLPEPNINGDIKIRRNALEVKKAVEEIEKEMLDEEKKWETPAFIRRLMNNRQNIG